MIPYFTTWSVGALVASLALVCICRNRASLSVLAAAISNSAAVSVGGPAVLGYGSVRGSCDKQHKGNFTLHSLPMLASFFVVSAWKTRRFSVPASVAAILALDSVWAATPFKGKRFQHKVADLYGVDSPWTWSIGFVALQIGMVAVLCC